MKTAFTAILFIFICMAQAQRIYLSGSVFTLPTGSIENGSGLGFGIDIPVFRKFYITPEISLNNIHGSYYVPDDTNPYYESDNRTYSSGFFSTGCSIYYTLKTDEDRGFDFLLGPNISILKFSRQDFWDGGTKLASETRNGYGFSAFIITNKPGLGLKFGYSYCYVEKSLLNPENEEFWYIRPLEDFHYHKLTLAFVYNSKFFRKKL